MDPLSARKAPDSVPETEPRQLVAVPAPRGVIEEIGIGVAELAPDGAVRWANPAARTLMEGQAGKRIAATLAEMAPRADQAEGHVEALVSGPAGDVKLFVASGPSATRVAFLERDDERAHRAQVRVLRTMLATVCQGGSPASAAGKALAGLAWAMPGTHLVLYEIDRGARALVPLAQARVPPGQDECLSPQPLGGDSAAARAVADGVPARSLARPAGAPARGALALPVRDGAEVLGALYASGPPEQLNEAELRLLQGMADAAASLLARERQAQQIAAERSTRHRLEEETVKARRAAVEREGLATLGKLTACIAHEINSPLAFMRSNLNVLGEHAERLTSAVQAAAPGTEDASLSDIAQDAQQIVRECLEGLDRIGGIIRSLKGLVRGSSDTERFDPVPPVRDAVDMFRRARREQCQVELSLADRLPRVDGSPVALSQVTLNLLENGLDAMGGRGPLRVRLMGAGGALRLEVEDQGPGIPEDIRRRVFEPYFTTKPVGKGTGLGLYICQEIVARMGGRISFDSGRGGTTFRVELPAS